MPRVVLPAVLPLLLAAAPPPPAVTLSADAPILARIKGETVALSMATGGVDRVTLNPDTVARLGLKPATLMGKAAVRIGRTKVLTGRNVPVTVNLFGQDVKQRVFWFPEAAPAPQMGSIGPHALPQGRVTVTLPGTGTGTDHVLPLYGDINSGAYGLIKGQGWNFGLLLDVRGRTRLPVASAAVGADLAAALGGTMVGDAWDEEIALGIRRPVRRLVLGQPLMIGPLRLSEIAVRVTDRRDDMAQLAPGQAAMRDADEDPAEIVVTADSGKKRPVVRILTVSRAQLDSAGCRSITYDKAGGQMILSC